MLATNAVGRRGARSLLTLTTPTVALCCILAGPPSPARAFAPPGRHCHCHCAASPPPKHGIRPTRTRATIRGEGSDPPSAAVRPRAAAIPACSDCDDSPADPRPSPLASQGALSPSSPAAATEAPFVGLPSYGRILIFAATTFLIWVSEPLLSLVDSAAVGRYAGTSTAPSPVEGSPDLSSVIQLAALGPATMLCDSSIYLTMFIAMAATNRLARAFAKHDVEGQVRTLSHVMGVSLVAGAALSLLVNLHGEALLAAILGPSGASVTVEAARGATRTLDLTPGVLRASMGYSRIRSVASPLAVMGLTSQAALLCAQDTRTPALAMIVASAVNVVGDYVFVARMRWGVCGAALATSIASLMANGMLVRKAWRMMRGWKDALREERGESNGGGMRQLALTSNSSEIRMADLSLPRFVSLPDRQSLLSLLNLAGPMFFVMVGKIVGYSAMTLRSSDFGMVSLACHNVLMRIFFFFGTVGDALSQSAQTFLPGLFYRKGLHEAGMDEKVGMGVADTTFAPGAPKLGDAGDARTLLKRLLLLSIAGGIVNCVWGQCIACSAGGTFTTDPSLVRLMSRVSPFMGLALLLHPLTMALEGSIIAASDSGYLVGTYVASLIALLFQLRFFCGDFLGVWQGLLLFQVVRITQFSVRAWKRTASSTRKQGGNSSPEMAVCN